MGHRRQSNRNSGMSPETPQKKMALVPPKEGVVVEWATAARVAGTKTRPRAAVNPKMLDLCLKKHSPQRSRKRTHRQHYYGPQSLKGTVAVGRLRLLDDLVI